MLFLSFFVFFFLDSNGKETTKICASDTKLITFYHLSFENIVLMNSVKLIIIYVCLPAAHLIFDSILELFFYYNNFINKMITIAILIYEFFRHIPIFLSNISYTYLCIYSEFQKIIKKYVNAYMCSFRVCFLWIADKYFGTQISISIFGSNPKLVVKNNNNNNRINNNKTFLKSKKTWKCYKKDMTIALYGMYASLLLVLKTIQLLIVDPR